MNPDTNRIAWRVWHLPETQSHTMREVNNPRVLSLPTLSSGRFFSKLEASMTPAFEH